MSYNEFGQRDAMRQNQGMVQEHTEETKQKARDTVKRMAHSSDDAEQLMKMLGL